jgi:hypothetical protein
MKKRVAVAIIFSFFLWIPPRISLAGTFRDNFDDGDMIGWKPNIAIGISVVNGELQFRGAGPLIVKVGNSSWKGYSLEARVRIAKFTNGGWFSIRILQGNTGKLSGYYEFRLAKSEIAAALFVNNRRVESFRVPTVVEEGLWHRIKIHPSNGKVSFYLDEVLTAQLTDLGLSGYTDICTTKGTHVYVDDVAISGPNIPDTGPSGPNSFVVEPRSKLAITWGEIKR